MFKLPIDKLNDFFAAVSAAQTLYLPVDGEDGRASYKAWSEGTVLSKALNTVRSAKDFFFPQTVNICDFNRNGLNIEVIDNRTESEDFVVFGVRACDARSFAILAPCSIEPSFKKLSSGVILRLSVTARWCLSIPVHFLSPIAASSEFPMQEKYTLAYLRSGATSARVMLIKLLTTIGSLTDPSAIASSSATASFILPRLYFAILTSVPQDAA